MEEEWSCYRGGHFNGGRMVMLQRGTMVTLMEGEWSCYFNEVASLMERELSFY